MISAIVATDLLHEPVQPLVDLVQHSVFSSIRALVQVDALKDLLDSWFDAVQHAREGCRSQAKLASKVVTVIVEKRAEFRCIVARKQNSLAQIFRTKA